MIILAFPVLISFSSSSLLLQIPFYNPTPTRFKIITEAKSFPSDYLALVSQIKQRGYDPATALIEVWRLKLMNGITNFSNMLEFVLSIVHNACWLWSNAWLSLLTHLCVDCWLSGVSCIYIYILYIWSSIFYFLQISPREGEYCLHEDDVSKAIHEHGDSLALVHFAGA